MHVAVVLFTRDLRVHDNPAFASTCAAAETVVPVFVHDPSLKIGENRARFLTECLADLRRALRERGGDLVELHGDPVHEAVRVAKAVGAEGVAVAGDVSPYARRRERRLREACERERIALKVFPGATVVPPGDLHPASGDHYKVFSPYYRSWLAAQWRDVLAAPTSVTLPDVPGHWRSTLEEPASAVGETAARAQLGRWLRSGLRGYGDGHDDLAGDRTSHLSPYLHFGCVSPREVVALADGKPGAEPFVRQLCWRDFYQQVLFAFGDLRSKAYRPGANDDWKADAHALDAWRAGQTGVPLVDAGMRQLAAEGWMHNRARLVTASYLTKHLGVDWRAGGDHFFDLLLDADVGNNFGNWQWVAGTGNDTRPYRRFNPTRQAERYDPGGVYIRRYVPELADVPGNRVFEPWRLPEPERRALKYPDPLESP